MTDTKGEDCKNCLGLGYGCIFGPINISTEICDGPTQTVVCPKCKGTGKEPMDNSANTPEEVTPTLSSPPNDGYNRSEVLISDTPEEVSSPQPTQEKDGPYSMRWDGEGFVVEGPDVTCVFGEMDKEVATEEVGFFNAVFAQGRLSLQQELEGLREQLKGLTMAAKGMVPVCAECGNPTYKYVCDVGWVCGQTCWEKLDGEIHGTDIEEIETDEKALALIGVLGVLVELGKGEPT